jgi:hypothetical protein
LFAGSCDDPESEENVPMFSMSLLLNITESHPSKEDTCALAAEVLEGHILSNTRLNPLDAAPYWNIKTIKLHYEMDPFPVGL